MILVLIFDSRPYSGLFVLILVLFVDLYFDLAGPYSGPYFDLDFDLDFVDPVSACGQIPSYTFVSWEFGRFLNDCL